MESLFQEMANKWPSAVVARSEIKKFTGGAFSGGYLANEDSRGRGPAERLLVGKRVVYSVRSLVEWLERRSRALPDKSAQELG